MSHQKGYKLTSKKEYLKAAMLVNSSNNASDS